VRLNDPFVHAGREPEVVGVDDQAAGSHPRPRAGRAATVAITANCNLPGRTRADMGLVRSIVTDSVELPRGNCFVWPNAVRQVMAVTPPAATSPAR
jgi:hypothetical protein